MRNKSVRYALFLFVALFGVTAIAPKLIHFDEAMQRVGAMLLPVDQYADGGGSLWSVLRARVAAHPFNLVATLIFFLAIIHTFCARYFLHLAAHLRRKGFDFWVQIASFFGDIELIFAIWVIPLVIAISCFYDWQTAVSYLDTRNYHEALFVIVVMALAATRPVVQLAEGCLRQVAKLGGNHPAAWWISLLTLGPLLGSLITEPAAMTLTALLLAKQFYARKPRAAFAYATIGLLFTNISVGGALTAFSSPAVIIVAQRWGWSSSFLFMNFGWKVLIGIAVANAFYLTVFWKEFAKLRPLPPDTGPVRKRVPVWLTTIHILLLVWVVCTQATPIIYIGSFALFLGFYEATSLHQHPLNLRLPLLVGLFLAGLVIHGGLQGWWIAPILERLNPLPMMGMATGLTAVYDNAAITYLSSLSPKITDALRYAVMAGALTGGGLTVIANAPNPAGQQILQPYFKHGVSPWRLFLGALPATIILGMSFLLSW